jgi:hypothetical protein
MLRIIAIVLNAALLILAILCLWHNLLEESLPHDQLALCVILLSLVVSIVNLFALLLVPPLFQRYWFRTCLKGKALEEQIELVEQARLNAMKKGD